jgi:uncharacterized membrane protein YfcA
MQVCNLLLSSAMASGARRPACLDPSLLLYVPPAVLGTCCGLCLFGRLSDRQFKRAVNLLLIVSGLGLLF